MDIDQVRSRFIKHFDGNTGNIYFSPGRINLIGEHTDYNGGFVFPGAVDKGIMAEVRPNGTDTVMCYSIDLKDRVEFKVDDPETPRTSWARYIYGIIQEMKKLGRRKGIQHSLLWRRSTRSRYVFISSLGKLLCIRIERLVRR